MSLDFLELVLNGTDLQHFVTGSAQPKLTKANLNQIGVPRPSLDEQHRAVQYVRAVFDRVAHASHWVGDVQERCAGLRSGAIRSVISGEAA